MPRPCAICKHPEQAQIEKAVAQGVSLRNTAKRFSNSRFSFSIASLSRHITARHTTYGSTSPPAHGAPGVGILEPPFSQLPSGSPARAEIRRVALEAREATDIARGNGQLWFVLQGLGRQHASWESIGKFDLLEREKTETLMPTSFEITVVSPIREHPEFHILREKVLKRCNGNRAEIEAIFNEFTEQPDVDPDEYTIGHEVMK